MAIPLILAVILQILANIWCGFGMKLQHRPLHIVEPFSSEEVPGIAYISRGYNIYFGNPHTTGDIDEGISGTIFDLSNCSNNQTYDGYSIPNGIQPPLPASTCIQTFTYNEISGANSYQSSLEESASFESKIFKAAFSASGDFKTVYNSTTTYKHMYTSSYTKCSCYYASLDIPYDLPAFTTNFVKIVGDMPLEYNSNNATNLQYFYDFFTKYFGTHYITGIDMGGIFGTLSSMDESQYTQFSSSNLDISVSASYSTIEASAGAKSMTKESQQEAKEFDSKTESKKIFNIGGDLPENNSAPDWQKTLAQNPMPIKYTFDIIPNLFTPNNFPKDNNIKKKQLALRSALNDYCNVLANLSTDEKIYCNGYPSDPTLPGRSIIKGFYSSNVGSEPKNPYNNEYSCDSGNEFEPILYSKEIKGDDAKNFNGYYCLNTTQFAMTKKDALNYFGGFYEILTCFPETAHISCRTGNHFMNGQCKCPTGYTQQPAGAGLTTSNLPHDCEVMVGNINFGIAQTFLCYNEHISLSSTTMAGMYGISQCSDAQNIVNPYTKTTSCHAGFKPYPTAEYCCDVDNNNHHCKKSTTMYMCLNNIYGE